MAPGRALRGNKKGVEPVRAHPFLMFIGRIRTNGNATVETCVIAILGFGEQEVKKKSQSF